MTDSRIVVYFDMDESEPPVPASVVGKYDILQPIVGYFSNCGFEVGDLTNWTTFVNPSSGTNATVVSTAYYGNHGCQLSAIPTGAWCSGFIRPATLVMADGDKLRFRYKVGQSEGSNQFMVWLGESGEDNYLLVDVTSPATGDWVEVSMNVEDFPAHIIKDNVNLIFYVFAGV